MKYAVKIAAKSEKSFACQNASKEYNKFVFVRDIVFEKIEDSSVNKK